MTPEETFTKYLKAFETLEPSKFTPYYHSPFMLVTPIGVFTGINEEATDAIVSKVVAQAKEQGYSRSEMPNGFACEALAQDLASLTGNIRRFNQANEQIAEFGISYLMRKVGDEWKLVVMTIHAPK